MLLTVFLFALSLSVTVVDAGEEKEEKKEGKEGKSEEGEGEKKEGGEEGEKKEGGEEGEKKEGEKSGAMSFVTTFLNSRGAAVCSGCLAEMKFNLHIL
ncbi:hypothetical protein TNIN_49771 [Trichonephila inaurata madagascariensis]|uniref:Uncharacterized protein n=1 Tax=Trichonephila inaurata madagascariensis TaxID=2747483 RepID=A0A8X6Y9S6_9ARAC|nr:hypothetical protein TNIN_49771 [Trichonephila inaurata madagascariensis]